MEHNSLKIKKIKIGILLFSLLIVSLALLVIYLYTNSTLSTTKSHNNTIPRSLNVPDNTSNWGNLEELREYIKDFKKVNIPNQLNPTVEQLTPDEYSYYFTIGDDRREFKLLHITDVHIGGGTKSDEKDKQALRAVAAMITVEKPDLVIFTGDTAFANLDKSSNLNNLIPATIIVEMMQKLGVYWALVYGNHDTENLLMYSRTDISNFYVNNSFYKNQSNYCLFNRGPYAISGAGNYIINIKNKKNKILKTLFLIDSNSYYFAIDFKSHYDRIHDDQINWYANKVKYFSEYNKKIDPLSKVVSSEMFFHIPINSVRDAITELTESKGVKTKNFERLSGNINENSGAPDYPGITEQDKYKIMDTICDLGSTEVLYFGHDHVNNAKFLHKGVIFSYGISIDYLAYSRLGKIGKYRGITLIKYMLNQEQSEVSRLINSEWYYQDKYKNVEGIPVEREVLTEEELHEKYNKDYPDWLTDPD